MASCVVPETVGYTDGDLSAPDPTGGPSDPAVPTSCGLGPPCSDYEECCDGLCVLRGGCVSVAQCSEQGQRCDLPASAAIIEQDGFVCARLTTAQDGGQCIATCTHDFSVDGCPRGAFCLQTAADGQPRTLCVDGECDSSAECTSGSGAGSCVGFGNEASFCLPAGLLDVGQPCSPAGGTPAELCAPDLFCASPAGRDQGVCAPLCDLWAESSGCPSDEACAFLTLGQGVCSPRTERGRDVFEACAPEHGWCNDGVECLDFNTGGEPLPVCTAYCRPADPFACKGPAYVGRPASCTVVFTGADGEILEDIGVCL